MINGNDDGRVENVGSPWNDITTVKTLNKISNEAFIAFSFPFYHLAMVITVISRAMLQLCPILFLFLVNSITFSASVNSSEKGSQIGPSQRMLRVMTFNIWLSGKRVKNGLEKIAEQIKAVDPDIVAIQELQSAVIGTNLTILLGIGKWKMIHHPNAAYPDTAIITKHKFISEPIAMQFQRDISDFLFHEENFFNHSIVTYGVGGSIELEDGQRVNVFSMHLDWKSYGPYAANNKQVKSEKQIMSGERNKEGYGRAQNIEQLLENDKFKKFNDLSEEQPFIVAGDFNSPSHLDWIEETKENHGGWTFEWPATKLLTDKGFVDSYRSVNPDLVKNPGETWSTVQKSAGPEWDWTIPEPQDRIDFIFFKPNKFFRPIRSEIYAGKNSLRPIPDQWENDWPSDHYAVITEFEISERNGTTQNESKQRNDINGKIVLNGDVVETMENVIN